MRVDKCVWSLILVLLVIPSAWSKSAEDYYHSAANLYVLSRLQEAGNEVESGLREHPTDPKLAGLQSLLKQLKDQQRQDQNQDQDSKKDPSKQDPKNSSGSDSTQQRQDPQESKSDKPKESEKSDSTQAQNAGKQDSSKTPRDSSENSQGKPPKAGQMSKEDAERLLNSFDNDEKQSQRDRQAPRQRVNVEEDW